MDPGVVGVFIPIIAVGGGFVLLALKMTLDHLKGTREHDQITGGAREEVERLTDVVEGLSAEVELLRSDYTGLNDRMDFTERLLEAPESKAPSTEGI